MQTRSAKLLGSLALSAAATLFAASASAKILDKAAAHCPADMAQVGASCVDKWEASLIELRDDGLEAPWSPYKSPVDAKVKAVSQPGVVPQAHVSKVQAMAACENAGKRLCHVDEWKSACKGPQQTKYPYGEARKANVCVDSNRTAPLGKLYSAKDMFSSKAMNDERLNQTENTVEKTGAAASCTNDYGVYDMVGNVHEWLDDGAFHGGYYLDTKINREGCDYATTAHSSVYYDYSTGFRCCADVDSVPVVEAPAPAPAPSSKTPRATPENEFVFDHLARVIQGLGGGGSASFAALAGISPAIPVQTMTRASSRGRRAKS